MRRYASTATWIAVVADVHQRQNAHGMSHEDVERLTRSVLAAMRNGKSGLGNVPGAGLGALIEESFINLMNGGYMTKAQLYGTPEKKKRRRRKQ